MYIIAGFLVAFVVLPNTINFRERAAFSAEDRLNWAQQYVPAGAELDSVDVVPGAYYNRNFLHHFFFGKKYRDVWNTPVRLPVLQFSEDSLGLVPVKIGGGQQTVGIDAADALGREWAVRSVNKDQSKALPKLLRPTLFRFMIRDQVAALNPYGALVVPYLAEAVGVLHTNPHLAIVAYNEKFGEYNQRMAGRVTLVEEDADGSWEGQVEFNSPAEVLETEEMQELATEKPLEVDTVLYARSRLLDMLISDWDRHEGQWNWAIMETDSGTVAQPIPVDRDMAFYKFDEGLIPNIMLVFNNKFQSFNEDYGNIKGLGYQSRKLDAAILPGLTKSEFINLANRFRYQLTDSLIEASFRQYPQAVYQQIGPQHTQILKKRRDTLPDAAARLYDLAGENREKFERKK